MQKDQRPAGPGFLVSPHRAVIHRVAVPGRPEDIVIGACTGADVLVMARNGHRPGPHSLEHANRFVVDHAPCTVVLTWP